MPELGHDGGPQIPPSHRALEYGEVVHFYHLDGMYSYCKDAAGEVIHLVAWQEVEIVDE
jgi:hypothetical protein